MLEIRGPLEGTTLQKSAASRRRSAFHAHGERSSGKGSAAASNGNNAAGALILWPGFWEGAADAAAEPQATVSPGKSLVWGPGLVAELTLPARYFAASTDGRTFTRSPPGSMQFKVTIKPISPTETIQIHVPQLLDRNDGSFRMQYQLYGSVEEGLKVEILYRNVHIAQSPYILKGPVYHEYCESPEEDPRIWENILSCPSEESQITKDFAALIHMFDEVPWRFGQNTGAIVHYTIYNCIYRWSMGKYTDFKIFSDEMLLSLARKIHLPDMEFYLNVVDWPAEHRKANDTLSPLPVLSWCGSIDTTDIVLPTYNVTHSTLETLHGVTNDLLSVQGNTGPVWDKAERGFFRGWDSREERLQLVLSKENPELIDAGITSYFFFKEKEKDLGKTPLMGFFVFKYKYQVSLDGTVAAYRFPYLLLGDSVIFKQDPQYYEHVYKELASWSHYIRIKRNLEDLVEKLRWAKENDEEVRKIAKEGQKAARELLQPHRFYCYYFKVFRKYAQRQASKPEIWDGMEFIPQLDDKTSVCNCHRKTPSREELLSTVFFRL
ncbi:LOW QUALITY PROTEIN: protein O-glucosyltransferase 3 [Liasis olivaceus]